MEFIFLLIWAGSLAVVATTRVTCVSIFLVSSILYSVPCFWTESNGLPEVVWSLVLAMAIGTQLLAKARTGGGKFVHEPSSRQLFVNLVFNLGSLAGFLIVIAISGFGAFFQGKYGPTPGGSITLYYAWNSFLIVTAAFNLAVRPVTHPFNLLSMLQLGLLFISGDRTLPAIYLMMVIRKQFGGRRPIDFFGARRGWIAAVLVASLPVALVSKSVYTLLPEYGFSWELVTAISDNYSELVVKDFEPSHSHLILVYATQYSVGYTIGDLLYGLLAVLPGSAVLGVDPHLFSETVKARFFSGWSASAGVGANFWAQGWVVGGMFGVLAFAIAICGTLYALERRLRFPRSNWCGLYLLLAGLFGFYVHRNSAEQILSFAGRYVTVFLLVWLVAMALWTVSPKKRRGDQIG